MREITLLFTLLFTLNTAFAQTTLSAGDIAFVGLNTDGAKDADDNFAFILLKDIDAATQIIFTDRGWSDATGFSSFPGDGEFTWTSGTARTAGEVIVLDFSNLSPPAASFTVAGDQLFAIQGSIASPTFISGLHFNVVTGVTDDSNWDGNATSSTTSALPDALTTGDTAVRLTGPGGVEQDNFQFSCGIAGCPLSGTPEQIRAIVHNLANWVGNNDTVYPGTVDASLGTPTIGTIDNMPPVITCPPDQTLMVDANCNTLVPDYTGLVTATDDVTASPTITQSPPVGSTFNGTGNTVITFTATDEAGNSSTCNMRLSIEDNKAPTPICINGLTVTLDATTGMQTIFATDFIASPITDPCGEVTYTISRATVDPNFDVRSPSLTLNCDDEETTLVRVWAEDVNGNSDYCETYVLVDKSQFNCPILPVVTCPADVTVNAGDPTDPSFTGLATATGGVGTVVITWSNGVALDGKITRTWTATDEQSNTSSCVQIITVEPLRVDLELEMSVNNATPNVGDPVTFTVVVTNQGPSAATGVEVTDQLPSGYIYAGFTTTQGSYNNGTGLWTLGSLAANGNATLTLTATVNVSGNYMNLAEVTAQNENDIDSTPNNGVDTNVDGNVVDDPGDEDDGDGAITAPLAIISGKVFVDFNFNGIRDAGEPGFGNSVVGLKDKNGSVIATTATDGNGDYQYFVDPGEYKVQFPLPTSYVFSPKDVGGDDSIDSDADAGLNGDTQAIVVGPGENRQNVDAGITPSGSLIDLELDVATLNPTPVVSGGIVNYRYTLTNKGPSTATGIEVEVIFPTGINAITSSFPAGTDFNFTTKIWSIPSFAAGITRTLVVAGKVNGNGDYVTLAEVIAHNEIDVDSSPNNGVDTDGDGNVIDDPNDEDDGDAETVTPIDNDPPVAVCQNFMVQLDNNGNAMVSVTDIDNGSTDNGAIVSYGVRRSVARMFDQNLTPDAIFGSGNANGGFTVNQTGSAELGLRAKVRYPSPQNTFNSNGDGTYSHLAGAGTPASRALWNFEWSVNTDPAGTAGTKLDGLTYEMGMDFDPSIGTDYFVFDPINQPVADHAIGTNMTVNGGGTTATDPASYAGLLAANNVAQNSWNLDFFNEAAAKTFDPTVDGTYEVYLKAFDGSGAKVGETKITVIVGNGGAPGMLPQSIDFTVADIGTNVLELVVADAAGNTAICTSTVTVKSACEIVIEVQPMDAEICAGDPLRFDVGAMGTESLSYQWQVDTGTGFEDLGAPSANSQLNFASMEIGGNGNQYRVVVTSDNGTPNDARDDCSATSEVATLTVNPLPMAEITGSSSYCHDGNGVVLDAGAGYTSYQWPTGETTRTITAVAGSYTVRVVNANGCASTSEAFVVTKNEELSCSITQDVLTTDHETTDGVATVNVTGGTGQFTYLWDNGETTQTATTLMYGMHSVTVTDSNGCETICQIDIAKELYCWTNLVQNVSVHGGNDGAARVQGNGGYRPYTFRWADGTTEALNTALPVGTHYVTITDVTGATSQCSVTIKEPTGGNCDTLIVDVVQDVLTTDHLTEDGVATVYPKGGNAQYTYIWDNGETTQTATTLTYGMHTVKVTDVNGCEASSQIDIAKELYCWTNLIKNVSDYGSNDGAARARGNGGYRPYTFKWDDGLTDEVNKALSAGIHYVVITDATGATSQCSVTISQPNEEVCDGIDNDGDGLVDEGFDQDGDGIADCFDICDKGDDHVDMDNDGIPDACDDDICIKVEKPMTECYQTAVWDQPTCSWIISGEKPLQPMTECYQTAEWNGTTCTWDIIDGQRPEMPMIECYQMAAWNTQTCSWDVIGDKPVEPMTECHQTAVWNSDNCLWDIIDGKPEMPLTLCYQTAVWSDQICGWEINGEKPMEPMTECYETATWNENTCEWDVTGDKPMQPDTECYQTAVWSDQICGWEINGEKPLEPMTECYETATWNEATCTWDILDGQTEMPMTLCYQTAVWSDQICDWEINGEKPLEPMTECYETATWNEATCEWDIEGVQPEMPMTQCQETAVWNELTCTWDIIENNNDCGTGTIDQCETAFARSADENVRSCFIDIPNVSGNRWGWTNEFPSTNGTYNMDLYAAAGQCTISNGALVGNVEVIYTDGAVEVTVSTLSGYKMTVAQLYVGTEILPTDNNGRFTTAPGQYPYSDTVEGDFNTFTFESVNIGNPGNFYVVLHADVCPNVTVPSKTASVKLELTAYPVPFKDYINLKIESPLNMNGTLSLYNGIGQQLQDFGTYTLKQGDNDINLNTGEIPIGLYFIRMTSVYGTETLKIIRK